MLLGRNKAIGFHILPRNPEVNITLPIQQIRKAGRAWLSELPIQLSRDLLSSCSMPGAQRDRERPEPSGKQGQQEGRQSPPPEWPGVLSALLASLRVSSEFAEEERWGHWALKWESKRLTRNIWSPSLIKNLTSMTRVPEAPRPPHFLTVTELKLIVPRILHYQRPSCGCEHLTNEQAGPLQRVCWQKKAQALQFSLAYLPYSSQPLWPSCSLCSWLVAKRSPCISLCVKHRFFSNLLTWDKRAMAFIT